MHSGLQWELMWKLFKRYSKRQKYNIATDVHMERALFLQIMINFLDQLMKYLIYKISQGEQSRLG